MMEPFGAQFIFFRFSSHYPFRCVQCSVVSLGQLVGLEVHSLAEIEPPEFISAAKNHLDSVILFSLKESLTLFY